MHKKNTEILVGMGGANVLACMDVLIKRMNKVKVYYVFDKRKSEKFTEIYRMGWLQKILKTCQFAKSII